MAATQSKYYSKLPKVSNITIGSSVSKRGTVAYTGENGKLGSCYIYFKQPSSTKSITGYQVQYRTRSHYTEEYQKKKGTEWNKWSAWKNARVSDSFTSPVLGTVPPKGTQEKYPMRKWLKGNRGINKKSRYTKGIYLTGHSIGPAYDGREFHIRIRTFNKATARHGKLVYARVKVWKRTAIVNERAYVYGGGGLDIRFQFKGSDNGRTVVNSIKDSKGIELLKPQYKGSKLTWSYDNYSDIYVRDGYTPAKTSISRDMLTRAIEYGESLNCDIVYTNEHKAPTKFALTGVRAMDESLKEGISIEVEKNANLGCLKVIIKDAQYQQDAIDSITAQISYTDKNGNGHVLFPIASNYILDGSSETVGTLYFLPPYNVALKIRVGLHSRYGDSCSYNETIEAQFNGGKYTLVRQWFEKDDLSAVNAWFNYVSKSDEYEAIQVAEAYDSVELSVSSQQENIYINPLGAKTAWGATSGMSPTTTISFTANVIDRKDESLACQKRTWESMRQNLLRSVFTLRTPYGEVYNMLIDSFSITKTSPYVYTVAIEATEVLSFESLGFGTNLLVGE